MNTQRGGPDAASEREPETGEDLSCAPAEGEDNSWRSAPTFNEVISGSPSVQAAARKSRRKRILWATLGGGFALLLTIGGISSWALNRFVIDHVEISDVRLYEEQQTSATTGPTQSTSSSGDTSADAEGTAATITDSSYEGANAQISIEQQTIGSGNNLITYYVATVELSDATSLRSAFAKNQFGLNIIETTSDIAADNSAIFAINGDYYGFRDTGIVIRNGVLYRDSGTREGLALYEDGTVALYDETATTGEKLLADAYGTRCHSDPPSSRTAWQSPESTRSRSTPTSETTRSRATSPAR